MLKTTSRVLAGCLTALAVCAAALPSSAAVPGQVDFQGLLLDSGGQKVNGAVDLVFGLYATSSGGSAVWTESHPSVQVSDGVYGVTLGSVTPLTPAILGTGNVYLQITVDGETLTPRRQLLAVPYALRAADADNLGGTSATFFSEMVQSFPFDGAAPANDDPSEGTADTDGDGLANFLDADNDADGLTDAIEVGQGSDINLVTPSITGFSPFPGIFGATNVVTVTGTNFEPGLTVTFGAETPTPQNLTATSFQVNIGPQATSTVPVTVARLNGQSDSANYLFRPRRVFLSTAPTTGAMGGVAGADARCAATANDLGLTGTFKAWLSDSTTSPAQRFHIDGASYARIDGTIIADSWADLTDGTLDASISTSGTLVYTGTLSNGTASGNHCNNWTSNSGAVTGMSGHAIQTNAQWTQNVAQPCALTFPVYCFEQ